MKIIFVSIFCILCFNSYCGLGDIVKITFIVVTNNVNDSENIFITGNDSLLGLWNPGIIKLNKINDSTWLKSFSFTKNKIVEYKFTKGDWSTEALDVDGSIPSNHKLVVISDTVIVHKIFNWKFPNYKQQEQSITGKVEYHANFQYNGLKPRNIIVWLPPSYDSDKEKRYPVFYLNDGQNVFDKSTSSFGYEWRVDETTDSLIKLSEISEIIVVGIYSTQDRSAEYSHSPLGYKYMDFVVNKLKPFIDSNYRTLTKPEYNAIGGASLGGLISFMLAWNYPQVFSKAACLSSAFKVDQFNYVDTVKSYSGIKKKLKLYLDIGNDNLEQKLKPGNQQMVAALETISYNIGSDLIFFIDDNAEHSEKAWAKRFWRPLIFFFATK